MNFPFIVNFYDVKSWDLYILENAAGAKTGYMRYPFEWKYNLGELLDPQPAQYDRNLIQCEIDKLSKYNIIADIYFSTSWFKDVVDPEMANYPDVYFTSTSRITNAAMFNMGFRECTANGSTTAARAGKCLWHQKYLGLDVPFPLYDRQIPSNDGVMIGAVPWEGLNRTYYNALHQYAFACTVGTSIFPTEGNYWAIGYSKGAMTVCDHPEGMFPQGYATRSFFVPKTGVPYTTALDGVIVVLWITEE